VSRLWYMWDSGVFQNDEIGRVSGAFYSAVSHIARDVKERMKKDPQSRRKVQGINSPSKM